MAFIAAAGISTFFTIPRLIRAIQGGDGAPDFGATAGNAAINVVGKYDYLCYESFSSLPKMIFSCYID